MNVKRAKELSMAIWKHLRDHPEKDSKTQLPKWLYQKIKGCVHQCPLCSLYFPNKETVMCEHCPLFIDGMECDNEKHPFYIWWNATTNEERKESAGEIYKQIKNWKI